VHLQVGKLASAAVAPSPLAANRRCRVVSDLHSGRRFLIDSGVEVSVIPPVDGLHSSSEVVLTAANGIRIRTYGPRNLHINIGLWREFVWRFEMAGVSRSIIETDLLRYYGLMCYDTSC